MVVYSQYVDLRYKPKPSDLLTYVKVSPSNREAIGAVAAESSIGTWTKLTTMKESIRRRLQAHVYEVKGKNAKIAYPLYAFEKDNVPQILSSIAGNVFGMKVIDTLRLQDVRFPRDMIKEYKGPAFGIPGIRKLVKVKDRPLTGTIIKPKMGLNAREHASVAYNAWYGGLDIVKDDENLSSQDFNPFKERITRTLALRDRAEQETGEKKMYMANITAETEEMIRRAEFVKAHGGEYVMVDIITCGFSALQTLRKQNLGLVIHAHRAMHAAFTRNKEHGIEMMVIAKLMRLIGLDQLHIGTVVGKMAETKEEVLRSQEALTKDRSRTDFVQDWHGLKPVFPVCSGGLSPVSVPPMMRILGKDIIIQAGGGVHGHPDGTVAGAIALRQAVDAAMEGVSLEEAALVQPELRKAVEHWKGQ